MFIIPANFVKKNLPKFKKCSIKIIFLLYIKKCPQSQDIISRKHYKKMLKRSQQIRKPTEPKFYTEEIYYLVITNTCSWEPLVCIFLYRNLYLKSQKYMLVMDNLYISYKCFNRIGFIIKARYLKEVTERYRLFQRWDRLTPFSLQ